MLRCMLTNYFQKVHKWIRCCYKNLTRRPIKMRLELMENLTKSKSTHPWICYGCVSGSDDTVLHDCICIAAYLNFRYTMTAATPTASTKKPRVRPRISSRLDVDWETLDLPGFGSTNKIHSFLVSIRCLKRHFWFTLTLLREHAQVRSSWGS